MTGDRPDCLHLNTSRVDLLKVFGGLRHLDASGEPSRVFAGLAGVCVPALCDECVVWISEQGQHPYRIRRASGAAAGVPAVLDGMLTATPGGGTTILNGSPAGAASVEIGDHAVIARFVNPAFFGDPDYRGAMVCRWSTAHRPDDAEAALVGIMVDHATALVQRERTGGAGPPDRTQQPTGSALTAAHRIAAASGILISLYHLSPRQARQLLARASENTHRPVIDIADTVLRTGALPANRPDRDTLATQQSADEPNTGPPAATAHPSSPHRSPSG